MPIDPLPDRRVTPYELTSVIAAIPRHPAFQQPFNANLGEPPEVLTPQELASIAGPFGPVRSCRTTKFVCDQLDVSTGRPVCWLYDELLPCPRRPRRCAECLEKKGLLT